MAWIKRKLRGNTVFVRVGDDGQPLANSKGLVEIVYKLSPGSKIYNASSKNLVPTGDAKDEEPMGEGEGPPPGGAPKAEAAKPGPLPDDAIIIYTDGACSKNPGPMGIGAVILIDGAREEIGEYLGTGTNNIAVLNNICLMR